MQEGTVERAGAADWERVRAVRLRALAQDPDAFGTLLAQEAARPQDHWRRRLEERTAATYLARCDGEDVGMASGSAWQGRAGVAGLFGMWVAPEHRGRGHGRALVASVSGWARDAGYERLVLDVGDENAAAIGLYKRMGFERTGATGSLPPPREHVLEHERELVLA